MARPVYENKIGSAGGNISITPNVGSNLGLLVYSEGRTNFGLSTPTWNGNNMTLLVSEDGNGGDGGVEIWGYYLSTTGSSITVVPNANGAAAYERATAICVSGADTGIALGDLVTYQADGTGDAGANDISETVAVGSAELLIDGEGHFRTTTPSATGTGQVEIETGSNYGRSYLPGGATSVIWDLNYGISNAWGWAAVVVKGVPIGGWQVWYSAKAKKVKDLLEEQKSKRKLYDRLYGEGAVAI